LKVSLNRFSAFGRPLVEAAGINPELVVSVTLHDLIGNLFRKKMIIKLSQGCKTPER
jgi:hypothetical protein